MIVSFYRGRPVTNIYDNVASRINPTDFRSTRFFWGHLNSCCLNLSQRKNETPDVSGICQDAYSCVQLRLSMRSYMLCDQSVQPLARPNFPRALNSCGRNCSASC
jgi:hypothetical protein